MAQSVNVPMGAPATKKAPETQTLTQRDPAKQAQQLLHVGFVAAPVIAGIDKFTHFLVDWDQYLAPQIANLSPIGGHNFMLVVGGIEIAAGLLVAVRPKIGGIVVAGWLGGIIGSLLMTGKYFDIALRDFGLALGALALSRLSAAREQQA